MPWLLGNNDTPKTPKHFGEVFQAQINLCVREADSLRICSICIVAGYTAKAVPLSTGFRKKEGILLRGGRGGGGFGAARKDGNAADDLKTESLAPPSSRIDETPRPGCGHVPLKIGHSVFL